LSRDLHIILTKQIVQFMAEYAFNNPGGYSYHHCANLAITAIRRNRSIRDGRPSAEDHLN